MSCRKIEVHPGGKLSFLGTLAYNQLKNIKEPKIVYIMAGIPDICDRQKDKFLHYEENNFPVSDCEDVIHQKIVNFK